MKKIILLFVLIIGSYFSARATHLMGGEIVVGVDSTNTAYVVMTLYRDNSPNTVHLVPSYNLPLYDANTGQALGINVTMTRVNIDTLPSIYPVERHIYTGTLQLPSNGHFRIQYEDCCRNFAILNCTHPGSEGMELYTDFTSFANTNSATPVFLNAPVVTFPLDTTWTYNPLPFDIDGDSLYWAIDTPVGVVHQYITGYTAPPANPGGALTMNPQSGQISWSPSLIGNYVISILVEEYRAGNKIGEIRRDMQFVVVPDTVDMQLVLPNALAANNGSNPALNFPANQSQSLSFELKSSYSLANLSLQASGDPFEISNSNASFQVQTTSAPNIQGVFDWTPTSTDARAKPYRLTLRASNQKFVYDFTVQLQVVNTTGLSELDPGSVQIFPNPANGHFKLALDNVESQFKTIQILDMQGKLIKEVPVDTKNPVHQWNIDLNAAPGTYILRLKGDQAFSKMFVIK